MAPTLYEFTQRAVAPAWLMSLAIYQFVLTIFETVFVHHEPGVLLHISKLRERAFSRFWMTYGPSMSTDMPKPTQELLRTVRGTVLDVGPGSGEQLHLFTPANITRMYGAEPADKLHDQLRVNARNNNLGDKYKVLHCGAEPESLIPALAKAGLLQGGADGIFDEIVCCRVLCGVPNQQNTIDGLYRLLKPGGRFVVHEHVVNPWPAKNQEGSLIARFLQVVYTLAGWPFWIQCHLDRDTKSGLIKAGGKNGWKEIKLQYVESWSTIPNLVGYLIKSE
ncbi:S-adenosyl-L-methionine-dependent methyltransferase [Saccharata proteae CBS 121410]|uniref:S-adenosyl-L-methionine-dependent methyltransferase n=1 Tax=Saccharata proteae CBS 121410 TaxID=1314787 RepID=A0A9P4HYK5_9PEZI|nr:S-adenosyl-L-methionine-dependent methyltransferase [Saccharata proteae CBS 121410]